MVLDQHDMSAAHAGNQLLPTEPPRESGNQCDQEDHKFKSNKPPIFAAETAAIDRQRQR